MAFENIIRCVEVPNEGRPSQLARRSCCPRCVFRRRPPSLDFPAVASVAWAARGGDTGLPGTPRLSFSAHLSLVANGAIVASARWLIGWAHQANQKQRVWLFLSTFLAAAGRKMAADLWVDGGTETTCFIPHPPPTFPAPNNSCHVIRTIQAARRHQM